VSLADEAAAWAALAATLPVEQVERRDCSTCRWVMATGACGYGSGCSLCGSFMARYRASLFGRWPDADDPDWRPTPGFELKWSPKTWA
jgi:hypothetical protein